MISIPKKKDYGKISLPLFTLFFLVLIFTAKNDSVNPDFKAIGDLIESSGLNIENELDRAVLRDALNNYGATSDSLSAGLLESYINFVLTEKSQKEGGERKSVTFGILRDLFVKAAEFLFRFLIIGLLLFYLSESFALLKFKYVRQNKNEVIAEFRELVSDFRKRKTALRYFPLRRTSVLAAKGIVKFFGYLLLFSPVYLVGYALKFNYENLSFFVYVFLAVFTNGMLISSVNKFSLLLESEHEKGYVETAVIKGVNSDYSKKGGISVAKIFLPVKFFGEHILAQIYKNAHKQFIADFKKIGHFLITAMIIVELALNYGDGLFYEMLKSLMKKEYDIFFAAMLLIFWLVKFWDFTIDFLVERENGKYENE